MAEIGVEATQPMDRKQLENRLDQLDTILAWGHSGRASQRALMNRLEILQQLKQLDGAANQLLGRVMR